MTARRFFGSTVKIQSGGGAIPIADALSLVSFRKINPSYGGPCCKIFRESDLTSIDIGFTSDYVNEADIASFCAGTIGHLFIWYDQSGNGNHFDSSSIVSASTTPIIYQSGAVVKEAGFVSIFINNANHRLIFTSGGVGSTSIYRSSFSVAKVNTFTTVNYLLWSNTDSDGIFLGGTFSGINGLGLTESASVVFQTGVENTNRNLQTYIGTSPKKLYLNGANETIEGGTSGDITLDRIGRNGTNLNLNGIVQEVLLYTTDQDSNRASIEADINSYYSIY